MKRRLGMSIILILLLSSFAFANSTSTARGKFGLGVIFPFPIALQINIGFVDIDLGIYSGANNLFVDWGTLFVAVDFTLYTLTFPGANFIDFSVGVGGYATIWFSRFGNSYKNHGAVTIGARVPLNLNFAIFRRKFDIFLKLAPGIGANFGSTGAWFSWDVFAGIGLRFWIV